MKTEQPVRLADEANEVLGAAGIAIARSCVQSLLNAILVWYLCADCPAPCKGASCRSSDSEQTYFEDSL